MHTTLTVIPGPIQATGSFIYQLDDTPGRKAGNLWGGLLSVQNSNEPEHLAKAVKLILAAEDMLAALKYLSGLHPRNCILAEVQRARAAIAKAEQE